MISMLGVLYSGAHGCSVKHQHSAAHGVLILGYGCALAVYACIIPTRPGMRLICISKQRAGASSCSTARARRCTRRMWCSPQPRCWRRRCRPPRPSVPTWAQTRLCARTTCAPFLCPCTPCLVTTTCYISLCRQPGLCLLSLVLSTRSMHVIPWRHLGFPALVRTLIMESASATCALLVVYTTMTAVSFALLHLLWHTQVVALKSPTTLAHW